MKRSLVFTLALALSAGTWAEAAKPPKKESGAAASSSLKPAVEPVLFKSLKWREVGPYRGGRAAAVTGLAGDRNTYYFGGTGGGVWKTTDGRPVVAERLRRLLRRLDRRRRRVGVGPQRGLRGWRRGDGARQRLARRRRLEVHRRRQDLEARRARRRAADPPHPHPPQEPRPRLRRRPRPSLRAQRDARRLPLQGRRRPLGPRPLRQRQGRARSIWPWTPATRGCSTPRPGTCGARPTAWRAAAPAPGSGSPPTAATPGPSSTTQPRPAEGDAGDHRRHRLPRPTRRTSGPSSRPRRAASSAPRRRQDLDEVQRRPQPAPARLVLHPHLRRPEGRGVVYVVNVRFHRSKDGGKTFTNIARARTATTTTCGSTRTIRSA